MAKAETTKLYRTFIKGLITEASPLTYPEDASSDEDNCIITRKGNRMRRFGAAFEDGSALSSFTVPIVNFDTYAVKEFTWESVNNDPSVNILVLQIGTVLHFWNLNSASISANPLPFTYDFTPMVLGSAATPYDADLVFTSGKGYLFAVGPKSEPFYLTYNASTNSITATQITIQIRDFIGLNDGLANDQEPTTLSPEHHYNLRNQGWFNPANSGTGASVTNFGTFGAPVILNIDGESFTANLSPSVIGADDGPINIYFTYFNRFPGNNKQWWVAQAPTTHDGITAGQFDPALLANLFYGSGHAPRGSYILNAFNKDYSSVSGVVGLTSVVTTQRPVCNTFFSGRIWYGCNNTVYFSQVLDDIRKAGLCLQEGDPTSQFTPDLLATDGGYIEIPDMINVIKLAPLGQGIAVFATNGVWFITGSNGGFKATDIAQSKISPVGITAGDSVVTVDHLGGSGGGDTANNTIYYWSKIGIQSLAPAMGSFGPVYGSFQRELVSLTTIQTFFDEEISDSSKTYVKGVYDPALQVLQWFFKTPNNTTPYLYDRILNLDLTLDAFYPWTVTSNDTSPWLVGGFTTPYLSVTSTNNTVVDLAGNTVVTLLGHTVVTQASQNLIQTTSLKYIFAVPDGLGNYKITFGLFNEQDYADWKTFNGTGFAYDSYMVTGFELLNDAMRNKQTPYVFCYFTQSENLWTETIPGQFNLGPVSSCKFSAQWGWSSSEVSNRWTPPIEAYRLMNIPMYDGINSAFDNGYSVVVTKNKIRGRGKAVQFRLENNAIGSGFDILGWAVEYTGGTTP